MNAEYWHQKWYEGDIGFHEKETNPLLVDCFPQLNIPDKGRVFIPLCGKTRDIAWCLKQGYSVVGVELNYIAVEQLFQELNLRPEVRQMERFIHLSAPNLEIYLGDIFDATQNHIGGVDGIYDRGALVALSGQMRRSYAEHLVKITDSASQLVITYEYCQADYSGPPFSIDPKMLDDYYGHRYALSKIVEVPVEGGLKGKVAATQSVWLMHS